MIPVLSPLTPRFAYGNRSGRHRLFLFPASGGHIGLWSTYADSIRYETSEVDVESLF